jgi:hypothetical protein
MIGGDDDGDGDGADDGGDDDVDDDDDAADADEGGGQVRDTAEWCMYGDGDDAGDFHKFTTMFFEDGGKKTVTIMVLVINVVAK